MGKTGKLKTQKGHEIRDLDLKLKVVNDMDLQPLSVFLVKNGQGGDRILFRYPYSVIKKERQDKNVKVGEDSNNAGCRSKYYRLPEQFLAEDILNETPKNNLTVGTLPEYPSKVLSN